jgi:hypothetical protein
LNEKPKVYLRIKLLVVTIASRVIKKQSTELPESDIYKMRGKISTSIALDSCKERRGGGQ